MDLKDDLLNQLLVRAVEDAAVTDSKKRKKKPDGAEKAAAPLLAAHADKAAVKSAAKEQDAGMDAQEPVKEPQTVPAQEPVKEPQTVAAESVAEPETAPIETAPVETVPVEAAPVKPAAEAVAPVAAPAAVQTANGAVSERTGSDFDNEKPLDKNVRLMSPGRMVLRRFFRSKLSIIGLVMIVFLIVFSWIGPFIMSAIPHQYGGWDETTTDYQAPIEFGADQPLIEVDEDGDGVIDYSFYQIVEKQVPINVKAAPSLKHWLGTDGSGMDVFVRLMYGGRRSLLISFIAVFVITIIGVVFGGIAGYFGGKIDNIIMRLCDILMCLPGLPILLILGAVLDSLGIKSSDRIYFLIGFLTLFSWSGTARLVRGQILFLREQEYMVAAEAMGFSTARKIFKHLVPNVMPQLIVSMTLSLGSIILYEASLSYLGLGVNAPFASWGSMVNAAENPDILANCFYIWGPPGICIIIAVLGFNFVGDGLRDALDPKMRR